MFTETNEKLQRTKDSLVELIAELDLVLEDVRARRGKDLSGDGPDGVNGHAGEPEWLQRIVRQRDVLMTVATMLAEMRFEWRRGPVHQHVGDGRLG